MNLKTILLLCGALIGGIGSAWAVFGLLHPSAQSPRQTESLLKDSALSHDPLTSLPCSLNTSRCTLPYQDTHISIESSARPIKALQPTTLRISGLANLTDTLTLKIYGLNMEMGTTTLRATKEGESYQATFTPAICSLQTMRYRIALYDGARELGVFIDFDVEQ